MGNNCIHSSLFALNVNYFQYAYKRETTEMCSNFHPLRPFTKVCLLLKEINCFQRERILSFILRADSSGMGKNCFDSRLFALNVKNFQYFAHHTQMSSDHHPLHPFIKVGLAFKERIYSQMEQRSIFFPLRAVPSGSGKTVSTLD